MKRILRSACWVSLASLHHPAWPVHAGHDHVADEERDLLASLLALRVRPRCCWRRSRVPRRSRPRSATLRTHRLVLDERTVPPPHNLSPFGLAELARAAGARFLAVDREIDDEARCLAVPRNFGEDEAAYLLDDAINGRKAEAGSLADLLGGERARRSCRAPRARSRSRYRSPTARLPRGGEGARAQRPGRDLTE